MIAINGVTGEILSAKEANNFTVYGYQPSPTDELLLKKQKHLGNVKNNFKTDTKVMAFVNGFVDGFVDGFEDECKHYYNNYAFAIIDLMTPDAELVSCLQDGITIEDTEYTTFNSYGTLFGNAIGDTETETQVLIINSTNGKVIVNSDLPGLGTKLLAYLDLYLIWGITF